jgi:fluoride exporter
MTTLYVGIGGALGALARFGIGGWLTTWAAAGFPWGTFAVNVLGSTLLGLFSGGLLTARASPEVRALLSVGLCGGFTTFSTFDHETLVLLQQQQLGIAAVYALGSVLCCIAGVMGGRRFAVRFARPPAA